MTPKLVRATKPALTGQHPDLRGDCSGGRDEEETAAFSVSSTLYLHDGNGQRHEWTVGIQSSRKLGVIEAEKLLKRESPSAIVTRVESVIDSR